MVDGTKPVTLSWDATVHEGGRAHVTMEPETFPMVEVYDSPFVDISGDGTPVPGTKTAEGNIGIGPAPSLVNFPEGFTFPYFGTEKTGIYPVSNGYISMAAVGSIRASLPLLEYSPGSTTVNIAPFQDDLRSYGKGEVFTKFLPHPSDREKDQFVVQWHRFQITKSPHPTSSAAATDDLTFQAALFRDGSIEFRYKTMVSPQLPARAQGSMASIGFNEYLHQRDFTTTYRRGTQLFFRPSNPIELSGRSYRYGAKKTTDSWVVTPKETTEYKICIELSGFKECKTAVVVVPAVGDLLITELNPNPPGGSSEQWFEVRHTGPHPFDLRGLKIQANAGEHVIAGSAPIVANPGEFLVFASSPSSSLHPNYVYGAGLPLGSGIDTLEILHGEVKIARVSWDSDWSIPTGKTLGLDAIYQRPHVLSNDDFSRWCETPAPGTPGFAESCSSAHYDVDPFSELPFIDISETGQRLFEPRSLNELRPLPGGLGFKIPFFDKEIDSLWISTNGFASVEHPGDARSRNERIPYPDAGGPGMIAPLWDALQVTSSLGSQGRFFYDRRRIDGMDVVILQWDRFIRFSTSGIYYIPGYATFQTQIWSNGDIVHAYDEMIVNLTPTTADPNPKQEHIGGSATVGIEAIGSQEGIQYLFEEPILREGQSIHYIRKAPRP